MKKITLLLVLLSTLSFTFSSCVKEVFCEDGEGDLVNVILDLDEFTGINSMGADDVYITQGDQQKVEVRGHENIIERLETEVKNGTWDISLEDGRCYTDYVLKVYITVPVIEEISITGSADIFVDDFENQNSLEIDITGSGDIELKDFLKCESLKVDVTGSGNIECRGEFDNLKELEIDIAGSGNFEGYEAPSQHCDIQISGSGNCEVNVNEKLEIKISGSGNIYYKGNPYISTNITGSGDIIDAN